MSRLYFMGRQEDPELDTWVARGTRVYDTSAKVEPWLAREIQRTVDARSKQRPGGSIWVCGDGGLRQCTCGECLFGGRSCEVSP